MGEFLDSAAADSAASIGRPSAVRRSSPAASHFDGGSTADRSSSTRRQSRSPYYQRYQEPPPSPSGARPRSSAVADAYAASVASRAIQPPVVDFRESNGAGATAAAGGGGGSLPDRSRQHAAAAALVASIERCSEPIQNGRALQSDIREIRRIIKAYVGRLQDREVTNYVAKEWRIVARVLDRLFFMLYIGTIAVSLATMFPKGEHRIDNVA